MPVTLYALLLLIFRFISMALIIDVIKKQRQLRKRPIKSKKAATLREDMYRLALVAMGVNVVPIAVDLLTIINVTTRPDIINPVSVVYMFSYAFGTLILTFIIWRMYKGALK